MKFVKWISLLLIIGILVSAIGCYDSSGNPLDQNGNPVTPKPIPVSMIPSSEIGSEILPTPSELWRGKIYTVYGSTGIADESYICQKGISDNFTWVPFP